MNTQGIAQLKIGQLVEVTHLAGKEIGEVAGFNLKSGKIDLKFNQDGMVHHCGFNFNQISLLTLHAVK